MKDLGKSGKYADLRQRLLFILAAASEMAAITVDAPGRRLFELRLAGAQREPQVVSRGASPAMMLQSSRNERLHCLAWSGAAS